MRLEELKAQRAKLDEQIKAAEESRNYHWSATPWECIWELSIHDALGYEIASVHGECDESKANARLIASAPELYQMLEEITAEYKALLESDYNTAEYAAHINEAERLLAKVRGGL